MPPKSEIFDRIINQKQHAQDDCRREYLCELAKQTGNDTILYASAFTSKKYPTFLMLKMIF